APFLQLWVVDTGSVVAVDDAKLKALRGQLVYVEGIDILHHQIPRGYDPVAGVADSHFAGPEKFKKDDGFIGQTSVVLRQFSDNSSLSVDCILVGHCEDLVVLQ